MSMPRTTKERVYLGLWFQRARVSHVGEAWQQEQKSESIHLEPQAQSKESMHWDPQDVHLPARPHLPNSTTSDGPSVQIPEPYGDILIQTHTGHPSLKGTLYMLWENEITVNRVRVQKGILAEHGA